MFGISKLPINLEHTKCSLFTTFKLDPQILWHHPIVYIEKLQA